MPAQRLVYAEPERMPWRAPLVLLWALYGLSYFVFVPFSVAPRKWKRALYGAFFAVEKLVEPFEGRFVLLVAANAAVYGLGIALVHLGVRGMVRWLSRGRV